MSDILRVLQVEDSEVDAALIIRLLEKSGYTVDSERVEDAGLMRQVLARSEWDVIIADYRLPQFDAAEALRIRSECARDVPFIVVSGTIGEDRAVEMIRAGAQDYVLKDRLSRLAPAVRREIGEAQSRRKHRRVEEQLRDRDEWLALAVDATQLGMFDFYPQSGRLVLSESAHRHVGLPADTNVPYKEIVGGLHPDDRGPVEEHLRKALNPMSGGEFLAEYRVIGLEDKVERWLLAQGKFFFDSEGQPIRLVGVTQDVTQRHKERELAENKILQLNARLEQRVIERTVQLQAANKELEAVNQELEAFSYSVAHDLRAPLRTVNNFAQMVLESFGQQLPEEGRRYLERICSGGKKMSQLIDDLLAFSRLSRQPMNGRRVEMSELVRNVLEELAPQRNGHQIEIEIGSLPPCYGDPALLKQVWANLLSNAIKYSRGRTPAKIEIGCHREKGEDIYSVRDNGAGFDMAHAQKLFGVFQRLHPADRFEGNGVGLAIVQRVVNRHRGRVWAEAEEDKGAIFRFSLAAEDKH